jgi:hypothetical protein
VCLVSAAIISFCDACNGNVLFRGKTTRENLKNQTTTDSENNQFLWFGGSETLFDPK